VPLVVSGTRDRQGRRAARGVASSWSVSAPALFVDDPLPLFPATMFLVLLPLSVINLVLPGYYMLLLLRPCCLVIPRIVGMGVRSRKTGRRLPSSNTGGGDARQKRPSGKGRRLNPLSRDDGGLARTSCYIGRVPGHEAHKHDASWVEHLCWVYSDSTESTPLWNHDPPSNRIYSCASCPGTANKRTSRGNNNVEAGRIDRHGGRRLPSCRVPRCVCHPLDTVY
jgi:hypothetical protein